VSGFFSNIPSCPPPSARPQSLQFAELFTRQREIPENDVCLATTMQGSVSVVVVVGHDDDDDDDDNGF
jgi:hypothetical protein